MKRISIQEREDWKQKAESVGFNFHTMYDEPYWDETSYYAFTLDQIENDIEDPSTELHRMVMEAVDHIIQSEELMTKMGIPSNAMDLVKNSWMNGEPHLYGRFDLVYNGKSPAKLLEYNADTPTSLYETVSFQHEWMTDNVDKGHLPKAVDQFNSVFEHLVERFKEIFPINHNIHFTSFSNSEDYATVETLAYAAKEAGLVPWYTEISELGVDGNGQFTDDKSRVIGTLFKLYPWEDLFLDDYFKYVENSNCLFIEPSWKAVVSNKGILPVLWKMFKGHKNLLPAYFENEVYSISTGDWVKKPIFSREGASIKIYKNGVLEQESENKEYDKHPMIYQEYCNLPDFEGNRPIIGSWVVGDYCRGIGIREDKSRITQNLSRFKPHVIMN